MGFNPEFTGRENVFMNAGNPRALSRGRDRDALRRHRSPSPTSATSSISRSRPTRAGCTCASPSPWRSTWTPDILVVDEALAVGDVLFQSKCYRKFRAIREAGKTVVFVSHSTDLVLKHCESALVLEAGRMRYLGPAKTGVSTYLDLLYGANEGRKKPAGSSAQRAAEVIESAQAERASPTFERLEPDEAVRLLREDNSTRGPLPRAHLVQPPRVPLRRQPCLPRRLLDRERRTGRCGGCDHDKPVEVYVRACFAKDVAAPVFGLTLQSVDGIDLGGDNTHYAGVTVPPQSAGDSLVVRFSLHAPHHCWRLHGGVGHRGDGRPARRRRRGQALFSRHAHRAQPGRTRRHGGPRPDDRRARLMDWPSSYVLDEDLDVRVRSGRAVAHEYSDGAAAEAYILESIQACDDVSSGSDELVQADSRLAVRVPLLGQSRNAARPVRPWRTQRARSRQRLRSRHASPRRSGSAGGGSGRLARARPDNGGALPRARQRRGRLRRLRDFQRRRPSTSCWMIGVLEYAPCYFAVADPIGAALARARACSSTTARSWWRSRTSWGSSTSPDAAKTTMARPSSASKIATGRRPGRRRSGAAISAADSRTPATPTSPGTTPSRITSSHG